MLVHPWLSKPALRVIIGSRGLFISRKAKKYLSSSNSYHSLQKSLGLEEKTPKNSGKVAERLKSTILDNIRIYLDQSDPKKGGRRWAIKSISTSFSTSFSRQAKIVMGVYRFPHMYSIGSGWSCCVELVSSFTQ